MKLPKEPKAFRYPRMYASFDDHCLDWCRLRIIEPDGKSQWFNAFDGEPHGTPCWAKRRDFKNGFQAVEALKQYCTENRMNCIYVGEIK